MPKKARPLPSRDELLALFDYEPSTGLLRYKKPGKNRIVGRIAGTLGRNGYVAVGVECRHIYAHRVIWKMMTGEEPPEIDHWDNDCANNRWANLRASDRFGNNRNQRKLKPGTSDFRGVYWSKQKNKWHAHIMANCRDHHLGFFENEEDAAKAYLKAAPRFHGTFANASRAPVA